MEYKNCEADGCQTKLSEGSPRYCPEHNNLNGGEWTVEKWEEDFHKFVRDETCGDQCLYKLESFIREVRREKELEIAEKIRQFTIERYDTPIKGGVDFVLKKNKAIFAQEIIDSILSQDINNDKV